MIEALSIIQCISLEKCDFYIGVEFERLKNETSGKFYALGIEEKSFTEVYNKLVERENGIIHKRKI